MKRKKLNDFVRGWFIGNFEPSLLKTEDFEVGIRCFKKGEKADAHYHKQGREYNCLISGKMTMHGEEINAGELYVIEPWEVANPVFLEDCMVMAIKIPGAPNDKFVVKE